MSFLLCGLGGYKLQVVWPVKGMHCVAKAQWGPGNEVGSGI